MNKKAVSPLIATILLIAFAVSIGSVIMNWSSTSTGTLSNSEFGECTSVSLEVIMHKNEKAICLDREKRKIILSIENGKKELSGVRVSYLARSSGYRDFMQPIAAGVLSKLEIDFDAAVSGEISSIKITPIVGRLGNYIYCSESGETFLSIVDCE
jgi:flagellin-like protein